MNDPRLVESVDVYEVVEVLRNADGEPILDREGEPIWLNLPPLVLDPKRRQPENLEKSGGGNSA